MPMISSLGSLPFQVYFKQADDLLRRLVSTRSRIADTEAAIEVLLDQRRNGLVA